MWFWSNPLTSSREKWIWKFDSKFARLDVKHCTYFSHSVGKREIHCCHRNYFSSNHFRVKLLSLNFCTAQYWKMMNLLSSPQCCKITEKILHWFLKNNFFRNLISRNVTFTEFLPKMRESKFPNYENSLSRIFGKTFVKL